MSTICIQIERTATTVKPDMSRVLLRPFVHGDPERSLSIISRVMAIPEEKVRSLLEETFREFSQRHWQIRSLFLERFEQVRQFLPPDQTLSEERRQLIGAYFLAEYSLESAALFNPSIVEHPDQSGLAEGDLRFILSLRATGEGHISSITFRTGVIHGDGRIEIDEPAHFLTEPRMIQNVHYEKALFGRKAIELGMSAEVTQRILQQLGDSFTLDELCESVDRELEAARQSGGVLQSDEDGAGGLVALARSNFVMQFQPEQQLSERILFPASPRQKNGIEDARFVRFRNDDGSYIYYATFTAYDGKVIMPEVVETSDFLRFKFITLNGPAARNKGMALFPRKINGLYAMLGRQDNENIHLMYSDNVHFWYESKLLLEPLYPWELVQLGNCGSPIETDAGWLVLSHGVGPMRKYCIGAFLLDREDPGKVIGRLREPLLKPNENEREGYVPNVVYTCGAILHKGMLVMPYGLSDHATSFAIMAVDDILAAMHSDQC